jgi:hypothetical protein
LVFPAVLSAAARLRRQEAGRFFVDSVVYRIATGTTFQIRPANIVSLEHQATKAIDGMVDLFRQLFQV